MTARIHIVRHRQDRGPQRGRLERDRMTTVNLTIVETIHYGAEFDIEDLVELAHKHGIRTPDPDGEDMQAWLHDEGRAAVEAESGMLESIEHKSGDVQGQDWEWVIER